MKFEIQLLGRGLEESLEKFLKKHAYSSMFPRSNLKKCGFSYSGKPFEAQYYAATGKQGKILGVIAHVSNDNLLLQAPEPDSRLALCNYLAIHTDRNIRGILGPTDQARQLIDNFGIDPSRFSINEDDRLFSLPLEELVHQRLPADEQIVLAENVEPSILADWLARYNVEALNADFDDALLERSKKQAAGMAGSKRHWVLLMRQKPVCLMGFNATLDDMVQVGPVYTPNEHRNNAYARRLTAGCLRHARTNGVLTGILFANDPAAIKSYQSIGFRQIGTYRLALLKEPFTPVPTKC